MELGVIGLGRMGAGIVRRLQAAGHTCVVHDANADAVGEVVTDGVRGVSDVHELVGALEPPRAAWVMVPAALTGEVVMEVAGLLETGDAVIDGGNTHYVEDLARAEELAGTGVDYVDVGTSGGVHGLARGFCLMVGGPDVAVARLTPLFDALAPGVEAAARTPGRTGDPATEERGWLHCGPVGAGHFVKMVHNGIEYGLMAAFAEGFALLEAADAGQAGRTYDAETAPLAHPERYRYDLDIGAVAELWRRGSVVQSWLLDLAAEALHDDPGLNGFAGRVSDSGEGRWTLQSAIELGVPANVLSSALMDRFASQGSARFAGQVQSAMRAGFGGHTERPAPG